MRCRFHAGHRGRRTTGTDWHRVAGQAAHPMRAGRFPTEKKRYACDNWRSQILGFIHAFRRLRAAFARVFPFLIFHVMTVKVAIAQINSTVGDLAGNGARIADFSRRAAAQGADIVRDAGIVAGRLSAGRPAAAPVILRKIRRKRWTALATSIWPNCPDVYVHCRPSAAKETAALQRRIGAASTA